MYKFHIFNTLTKQKEEFNPWYEEGKKDFVGIYSCGPTVYGTPHIGNIRYFVFCGLLGDVIKKILEYPTTHVMNITDVGHLTDDADEGEDKLQKGAESEGLTAWDIAKKYEKVFLDNLDKLDINFDYFPRATEHIQDQIDLVKKLEENGYTYTISGDGVYMDTSKIDDYGKLAQLDKEGLLEGARIENEKKKNSTDFALWKFSPQDKKRHMERDSPWGVGFPGWHIECSAMSRKYLGDYFDIHTGGVDHIQVHHTNEIAQSECSFANSPWVRYWMHSQFLNLSGEKIAKSEGNVEYLNDLLEQGFEPEDIRYLFFTAHYRSFLDFNYESLSKTRKTRLNIIKKLSSYKYIRNINIQGMNINELYNSLESDVGKEFFEKIIGYLLDDLSTPKIFSTINDYLKDEISYDILKVIIWLDDNVLKLGFFKGVKHLLQKEEGFIIPMYIQELADYRMKLKKEKKFDEADKVREKIHEQGFYVVDTKDGYEIKLKDNGSNI